MIRSIARYWVLLTLAITALLLVDACGDKIGDGLEDAGSMLRDAGMDDAGNWLADAGSGLGDAGADASAQGSGGIDSRSGSRLHVRRVVYAGSDGSQLDTGTTELTDTLLGVVCARSPYPMSDGTRRCVPTVSAFGSSATPLFADASCISEVVTAGACGVGASGIAITQESTATCASGSGSVTRVFTVGVEHAGSIYVKSGASCLATTRSAVSRYFLKGAEVSPSTYVELTDLP